MPRAYLVGSIGLLLTLTVVAVGADRSLKARRPPREATRAGLAAAAALDPAPSPGPRYRILELATDRDPGDRLRGDWEIPNALVLAFSESWSDSLADLIAIALDGTQVYLLVDPATEPGRVERWLDRFGLDGPALHLVSLRLDTPWVRDYGPFEVRAEGGERRWLDAAYVDSRPLDDAVPSALAALLGVPATALPDELQGGAFISNGRGLCAATLEYLDEHRIDVDDPGAMDPLLAQLGCRVLALVPALADDRTLHADMFAQFLAPDVVAVADVYSASGVEDAARMEQAALGILEAARRLRLPMRVVRVPVPYFGDGKYRTYLNGLRLPAAFVAPRYRDVPDDIEAEAYRLLSAAMPGTNVAAVPADEILQALGSLHCITVGLTVPREAGAAADAWSAGTCAADDLGLACGDDEP